MLKTGIASAAKHLRKPHTRRFSQQARIESSSQGLRIDANLVSFPRLRDSCQCPRCVHVSTRQKLHTSGQAFTEARASQPAVRVGDDGVDIAWRDHSSHYPWRQLKALTGASTTPRWQRRRMWDSGLEIPKYDYANLQEDMPGLLRDLHSIGIVLIRNAPVEKTSSQECTLREIATSIGEIRNTFYGELWDVKSVKQSRNVAYTNLDLGLHMDLLYFSNPPRFQALHCLRNRVRGGESYVVDAFRAVELFRQQHPQSAKIVNEIGIEYEYDNDGHFLRFRHPLFSNDLQDLHAAVNWSPPFQSQATSGEDDYYEALHEFEQVLGRPDLCREFLMQEGDAMIFDNRRILHARRAFEDEGGSGPNRWLKGCYLDGEVIWDRLAVLNR